MYSLKDIDISLMKSIPKDKAIEFNIVAIKEDDDKVFFITDSINDKKKSYLSMMFTKELVFLKQEDLKIRELINNCYSNCNLEKDNINFIEKELENLINEAMKFMASDIHIEPQRNFVNIRFRVDGSLILIKKIQREEYLNLTNKIKLAANMDISDKLKAQDGKISFKTRNDFSDLRISSLPTVFGEKIVIRILYKNSKFYNLENLNFSEEQIKKVEKLSMIKNGMVLVNGPTGSGKSTTLYSIINKIKNKNINISTIEDPVEIYIDGITQTNVNKKAGLMFNTGLKHILRQDPDVILVGEIRDEETAKIAVRASITGHKVFSTIHTNNGNEVYYRLKDMGVEEYLIKQALKGVITQRLVKKLCNECKEEYILREKDVNELNLLENKKIFKACGCKKCNYTGYRGRVMLSEIVIMDDKGEENGFGYEILKNCMDLVFKGIIDLKEYLILRDFEGFGNK